jgi:5'-nucleotidase
VVQTEHEKIDIHGSIPSDPSTAKLVEDYKTMLGEHMNDVVGVTAVPLDGRFNVVRTQETNLGNLVADIIHHSLNTDPLHPLHIAFLNAGSLRSDRIHAAGVLRLRDLNDILPYMDRMSVVEMTGDRILGVLENSVSAYPKLDGRFLQVCKRSSCLLRSNVIEQLCVANLRGLLHYITQFRY